MNTFDTFDENNTAQKFIYTCICIYNDLFSLVQDNMVIKITEFKAVNFASFN